MFAPHKGLCTLGGLNKIFRHQSRWRLILRYWRTKVSTFLKHYFIKYWLVLILIDNLFFQQIIMLAWNTQKNMYVMIDVRYWEITPNILSLYYYNYRIYSRISQEILDTIYRIFSSFDLYAGQKKYKFRPKNVFSVNSIFR